MTPAKRQSFFARLRGEDPEPRTELAWSTPFELLVAVILSAQATDKSVNLVTAKLFAVARTPAAILKLGRAGLKEHVRTIGLFNAKTDNIMATCAMLLERHGGEVPRDRAALEALAGVGRKTANVVLNVVFGEPTIAVDTHIFRVANRTGLAPGRNVEEVERRLLKVVPAEFRQHAHHWLILLGRYTCKARRPECWHCAVHAECAFRPKTPAPVEAVSGSAWRKRS